MVVRTPLNNSGARIVRNHARRRLLKQDALEVLIADYEQARDDERQLEGVQVALLGMLVASYVAMLTLLNKVGNDISDALLPDATVLRYSLVATYALAPLIVFLPTALAQFVASRATIRSFYIRGLEHQIRTEWQRLHKSRLRISAEQKKEYPAYSLMELLVEQGTMARGANRGFYFLISVVFSYASAIILTILGTYYGLNSLNHPHLAMVVAAVYVAFSLILGADAFRTNIDGHSFFMRTIQNAKHRFETGRPKKVKPSYSLWLPRPDDLSKLIFEVAGIFVAATMVGNWSLKAALLAFIASLLFELVFYQGRYIVNDLIEVRTEPKANHKSYRSRLSKDDPHKVGLALLSLPLRILFTIILIFTLSLITQQAATLLKLAAFAVIVITVAYEFLRARSKRALTGSCGAPTRS